MYIKTNVKEPLNESGRPRDLSLIMESNAESRFQEIACAEFTGRTAADDEHAKNFLDVLTEILNHSPNEIRNLAPRFNYVMVQGAKAYWSSLDIRGYLSDENISKRAEAFSTKTLWYPNRVISDDQGAKLLTLYTRLEYQGRLDRAVDKTIKSFREPVVSNHEPPSPHQ